jgi:hypothetical protein
MVEHEEGAIVTSRERNEWADDRTPTGRVTVIGGSPLLKPSPFREGINHGEIGGIFAQEPIEGLEEVRGPERQDSDPRRVGIEFLEPSYRIPRSLVRRRDDRVTHLQSVREPESARREGCHDVTGESGFAALVRAD